MAENSEGDSVENEITARLPAVTTDTPSVGNNVLPQKATTDISVFGSDIGSQQALVPITGLGMTETQSNRLEGLEASTAVPTSGGTGVGRDLVTASREGKIEIVAMLLKIDGIDVNNGVSIMITTTTYPLITLLPFTLINHVSVLFPPTVTSRDSLGEWSYRGSGFVVEGRGD